MDIEVIEETDRYRIGLVPDESGERPDDDASSAVYRIEWAGGYYRAEHMGGPTLDGFADAVRRFGRDDDMTERYARIVHGAVSVAYGDTRDARYVGIVTRQLATEWGHDADADADSLANLADVSEWVAWARGEVYAWVIQERVTWTTDGHGYDDRDEWEHVDSTGGFYGYEWATLAAREEWHTRPEGVAPVWALWHGGANYSPGYVASDCVKVDGISGAIALAESRYENADGTTPCVTDDAETWVYFADPREASDPYPDRIVKRGAAGQWVAVPV